MKKENNILKDELFDLYFNMEKNGLSKKITCDEVKKIIANFFEYLSNNNDNNKEEKVNHLRRIVKLIDKENIEKINEENKIFKDNNLFRKIFDFYINQEKYYKQYLNHSILSKTFKEKVKLNDFYNDNFIEINEKIIFNLFHKIVLFLNGKIDFIYLSDKDFELLDYFFNDNIFNKKNKKIIKGIINDYKNIIFVDYDLIENDTIEKNIELLNVNHFNKNFGKITQLKYEYRKGWPNFNSDEFLQYLESKDVISYNELLNQMKIDGLVDSNKKYTAFTNQLYKSKNKEKIQNIFKKKKAEKIIK